QSQSPLSLRSQTFNPATSLQLTPPGHGQPPPGGTPRLLFWRLRRDAFAGAEGNPATGGGGTEGPGDAAPWTWPARTVGCAESARVLGSDVAFRLQVQDDLLGGLLGRELGRVDGDVGVVGHLVGIGDAGELGQCPSAGLGVEALAVPCLAH